VADHRTTSPSAFRIAVAQVELAGAPLDSYREQRV